MCGFSAALCTSAIDGPLAFFDDVDYRGAFDPNVEENWMYCWTALDHYGFLGENGNGCCANAGDANHDGGMNIADASYIINKIFFGGADYQCAAEADANADGNANIADASFIINAIFFGGNAPTCGPE